MEILSGKAILHQIAYGRLRFVQRVLPQVSQASRRSGKEEWERFLKARRRAVLQLAGFYDEASGQIGSELASVFAVHAMLLEDEDYEGAIRTLIWEKGTTAEYAVRLTGESFAAAFAEMDDPYMQARAVDIRDISLRVLRILLEKRPTNPLREGSAILVANEFLPSEVMDLDRRHLLGLVSRKGSIDSHAAILLRAYRIPAMAGVELDPCWDGHLALMDGFDDRLYLDPEHGLADRLRVRYQEGGRPAMV